ncbi:MAG TPA: helix-turn-helix transcriptional regulator, partial [Thermoanaerobaculia bacterium]|nr:helix-turn-helix transcriptional regulator [Thermoanaerobaculia bacterium]
MKAKPEARKARAAKGAGRAAKAKSAPGGEAASGSAEPSVASLVRMMRGRPRWTQKELARAARLHPAQISAYENGKQRPRPATLARLAAAAGTSLEALREAAARDSEMAGGATGSASVRATAIAERVRRRMESALGELAARISSPRSEPEERAAAEVLWQRLAQLPPADRLRLVEISPPFQSWALVERLAHESEKAAVRDAGAAITLAELALRAAERAAEGTPFRAAALECAWVYLANARRVRGDHEAAEAEFAKARRAADPAGEPSPFSRARLLDREASLRRDQRRFPEALALHGRALVEARPEEAGFVRVNHGYTLQQMGRAEDSIASLRQALGDLATPGAVCAPRCRWGALFNLAGSLLDLKRQAEAEALLPEVRALVDPADELDRIRLLWLEGKVAAGAGRIDEAAAGLDQVRREFADRKMGYDAALAALEEAALLLERGRTSETRALVDEALP